MRTLEDCSACGCASYTNTLCERVQSTGVVRTITPPSYLRSRPSAVSDKAGESGMGDISQKPKEHSKGGETDVKSALSLGRERERERDHLQPRARDASPDTLLAVVWHFVSSAPCAACLCVAVCICLAPKCLCFLNSPHVRVVLELTAKCDGGSR